jgi:hypothetical protein
LGYKTPIWKVSEDGSEMERFSFPITVDVEVVGRIAGVTSDLLRGCLALAGEDPPLAWILLRDARSLREAGAGQRRRAVIDAATPAELAVTAMLDGLLKNPKKRAKLEKKHLMLSQKKHLMLGQKTDLLDKLGSPLPQSFYDNLVYKRNDAVHEGRPISYEECSKAIAEAVPAVETAFPLPTPPESTQPLRRLW